MTPLIVESDDWRSDGANVMPELLKIEAAIARTVLVLEHWFYRGSRAPQRTFWEEFGDLKMYLETESPAG
jgi:hypothetical protein